MKWIIIIALAWCFAGPALAGKADRLAPRALLTEDERGIVEEFVKRLLLDPELARFGSLVARRLENFTVICGEVNAKNRFGGYIGKMPFIGEIKDRNFEIGLIASKDDEILNVLLLCKTKDVPIR